MDKKTEERIRHLEIDIETERQIRNRRSWEPSESHIRYLANEKKTNESRRLGWPGRGY